MDIQVFETLGIHFFWLYVNSWDKEKMRYNKADVRKQPLVTFIKLLCL